MNQSVIQYLWLFLLILLVGCDQQPANVTTMSIAIPRAHADDGRLSLTDYPGASVDIRVNGGATQSFPRQNSDTWLVALQGVILNEQNSVEILWSVMVDDIPYTVATQTESFLANPVGAPPKLDAPYVSAPYDHDNDTVTNLAELYAGGFPVPEEAVPEVVSISTPGTYTIGSPVSEHGPFGFDTETQIQTAIANNYAIGQYEVTFAQYDVFANAVPRWNLPDDSKWGRDKSPVINITWEEANEYTHWLSSVTGRNYRLPTEAEWEYAARGGTNTAYTTGASINTDQSNFSNTVPSVLSEVFFNNHDAADGTIAAGVFRRVENNVWGEYRIDPANRQETLAFFFVEQRQDAGDIWLYDESRDVWVVLSTEKGEILFANGSETPGLLYIIVENPNPVQLLVGQRTVPVGSFAPNDYGLFDVHGNVWEWTCSMLQAPYAGAEQTCVDPAVADISETMIKRGGAWGDSASQIRSAKRGWNNDFGARSNDTGFRVAMEP